MWSRVFWRAVAERSVSTAAQAAILVIGADAFNVVQVEWLEVAGFAAGGATLTILKSLAAGAVTGDGPSLIHAETVDTPGRHEAP